MILDRKMVFNKYNMIMDEVGGLRSVFFLMAKHVNGRNLALRSSTSHRNPFLDYNIKC